MNSDNLLAVQFGVLALLTMALITLWGDINFRPVRKLSGLVRGILGVIVLGLMTGILFAPKLAPGLSHGSGKEADLNWPLISIKDGKQTSLADFKGKVLFVNIWATWCGPCVAEMPSIEKLYGNFKDRDDVAFLLVSIDQAPELPAQFAGQRGMKTPIYFSAGQRPSDFKTRGIPATFILGKDGRLANSHVGSQDWNRDTWVNLIDELTKR